MAHRSRILVVEDDETLRGTIADVLSDEGHEVRVAADGLDALESLESWEPDVLILDVMMPRMDAYEFRERQLATSRSALACVVVVSAAIDVERAATRLRANAWLAKPFTLESLVAAVERCLQGPGSSTPPPADMVNGTSGAPA